jgi:hypothetical protein
MKITNPSKKSRATLPATSRRKRIDCTAGVDAAAGGVYQGVVEQ